MNMSDQTESIGVLARLSDELANAVETAGKSVVRIEARRRQSASGIVWSVDGLIVTADHVIERDDDLVVGLPDGRSLPARIVGRDPGTDLAVLRVDASGLVPIVASESPRVGNFAIAVARPGETPSVSLGVISALGGAARTARGGQLDGFIRTDAILYPGFSGGALIDVAGHAFGLTTSHFGQGSGFAIQFNAVKRVVEALIAGGSVKRAFLGITSQPAALPAGLRERSGTQQETGLLVLGVEPGGPADSAGIILGDILIGIGGDTVRDTDDLRNALRPDRIGQLISVRVIRGGEPRDVPVTVGERA